MHHTIRAWSVTLFLIQSNLCKMSKLTEPLRVLCSSQVGPSEWEEIISFPKDSRQLPRMAFGREGQLDGHSDFYSNDSAPAGASFPSPSPSMLSGQDQFDGIPARPKPSREELECVSGPESRLGLPPGSWLPSFGHAAASTTKSILKRNHQTDLQGPETTSSPSRLFPVRFPVRPHLAGQAAQPAHSRPRSRGRSKSRTCPQKEPVREQEQEYERKEKEQVVFLEKRSPLSHPRRPAASMLQHMKDVLQPIPTVNEGTYQYSESDLYDDFDYHVEASVRSGRVARWA